MFIVEKDREQEHSGQERFQPGPGKEHFEKFKAGPSEEELKKFRGPEWRKEPLDIRMQLSEGNGGRLEAERRREEKAYLYVDPNFLEMVEALRTVAMEKPPDLKIKSEVWQKEKERAQKEKERARERLPRDWERLMGAQLGQLESLLENHLMRFKSPYPYDSRRQELWFESLQQGIKRARSERWATDETRLWLDRVAIDATWGENNFKILESVGTVLPSFFDWKKMLTWVRERMRSDPVTSFYQLTFEKEIPGRGLTKKQKESLPAEVRKGLRERAVKYQDDCAFWRMAVAAVHQLEYDENGQPRTFMEELAPAQTRFIQLLFQDKEYPEVTKRKREDLKKKIREKFGEGAGEQIEKLDELTDEDGFLVYEGQSVPKSLLSWNAMSHAEEKKRRYLATMEALLVLDVKKRLGDLIQKAGEGEGRLNDQAIRELVDKVREWIDGRDENGKHIPGRLENWFSLDRELDERLAGVVVMSGIVMDWGHMSASRFAWGWNYKIDVEGEGDKKELKVVREKIGGATTVATDSATVAFWRDEEVSRQRKGWSKGLFPRMSERYRKMLEGESPNWIPHLSEEMIKRDPQLAEAWWRLWAKDEKTGWQWKPEVKKALEDMVWYWETPYMTGVSGREFPIILPMFFPPEIASLNFWNTISLEEEGKLDKDPTVWDQLKSGKKMSEFDWVKMGDQAFYRWMITIGQIVRYTIVMLEPESTDKVQFEAFFEDPGKLFELLKRVNLGERDEKEKMAILTMALVPMLVVLRTADKHGIIGEAGVDESRRTIWADDLAKWINMFTYLPKERDNVGGYGEGMARLAEFYATLVARLGNVVGEKERDDAQDIYNKRLKPAFQQAGAGIKQIRTVSTKPPLERT